MSMVEFVDGDGDILFVRADDVVMVGPSGRDEDWSLLTVRTGDQFDVEGKPAEIVEMLGLAVVVSE